MKRFLFLLLLLIAGCKKASVPPSLGITNPIATIDLGSEQQTIRGFGGSSAWSGVLSDAEMNTLYGNDSSGQFGLTILRVRIDPEGVAKWGDELSNAQKAIARGAIVMATPWAPPASMKSNNDTKNGGKLNLSSYAGYSAYLGSYASYMAGNAAPLYALSIQNEPELTETYESCVWAPSDLLLFIKSYPPAIGSTKLMTSESFHFDHAYTDTILNDATASANVSIIGGHIYGGGLAAYPLAVSKGKEIWMTEHLDTATTMDSVLNTAKEINDCMTTGNFNAYVWWYLKKSWGLIDENSNPTKRGYIMGQFSKFIRPGSQRLTTPDNLGNNIYISAYKNGSQLIIVAINTGTSPISQPFTITGGTLPISFTPHITSDSLNISTQPKVNVSKGAFTYSLLPRSVTTFTSN